MAVAEPRAVALKTGEACTIRSAESRDAVQLLENTRAVVLEPDGYNVTTPDEFDFTEDQERDWIEKHRSRPGWIALVAEVAGEVIGHVNFKNLERRRLAHVGMLGMSVALPWRGRGVGDALLRALLDWAADDPLIEKVSLGVIAGNEIALALYRKHGFVEEGRRHREIKYADGRYADDLLMYRWV